MPQRVLLAAAGFLLVVGFLDALALGGVLNGHPPASGSSAGDLTSGGGTSIAYVAAQYLEARKQLDTGEEQVAQQSTALAGDISKQEQRIQTDSNSYWANAYGVGCGGSISLSAPSAYNDCVTQEEGLATNAANDSAAASTQLTDDRQQLLSLISPLSTEIDDFVARLADIQWPSSDLRGDAEHLSLALVDERTDLEQEVNAYEGSDFVSGEQFSTDYTSAESTVENWTLVMNGALRLPPPVSPATAVG